MKNRFPDLPTPSMGRSWAEAAARRRMGMEKDLIFPDFSSE